MKKILLIASIAFVFAACKDRNRDLTLTQPGTLNGQFNSSQANASKTTSAQLPVTNVTGGAVNPAHGMPGHRCDLSVGAPLPSGASSASQLPTVTTTETPISTTISQLAPANSTVNTVTPGKASGNLNPAHGQPGHRCDISVGAPLNSAPAAKSNNAIQNIAVQPVNNPTPTAPGMNPQHGQPGHRCDIAVGAPLNSAPPKVEEKKDSAAKN